MADILIDTLATNPYETIVADTTTRITWLDAQIAETISAIGSLEKSNPTSANLPKLRERLAELQAKRSALVEQNNSAKSLMMSFDSNAHDITTLAWINQLKQEELQRAQQESDKSYKQMYEDTKRLWTNYLNASRNATASENAIINANAWRYWASVQSTAETRARNYLNNAAQWAEIANNNQQQLNAIEEWRLNSNAWYVQLSQANADNYLRQQVMNDRQAAENQKDRNLQKSISSSSSSSSSSSKWKYTDEDVEAAFSKYADELKKSFWYDNMSDEEKIAFEIKIWLRDPEEETKEDTDEKK